MLLRMQNFSLYGQVVFHCVSAHPIFFIQSSADGHLECFHVFAVVSRAAVSIGVHVPFQIRGFVFFGYIPRNVVQFLVF